MRAREGDSAQVRRPLGKRCLREPRSEPDLPIQALQGDAEERADNRRVEVAPCATSELDAGSLGGHRVLVGANRGHDLEGVCDADDPRTEGDLLRRKPEGITIAVIALVMLLDYQRPLAEPRGQRCDEASAFERVPVDRSPLLFGQRSRFREDPGVNGELAHVMQQRGPPQAITGVVAEVHLLSDHLREDPHALGMPPGGPVVVADRRREAEDLGGRPRRLSRHALAETTLEVARRASPHRHGDARGGPIGEQHRQLQERGEGQQSAEQALGAKQGRRRSRQHHGEPAQQAAEPWRPRERPGEHHGDRRRRRDRQNENARGDALGGPGVCRPTVVHLSTSTQHNARIGKSRSTLSSARDYFR
ncbi:MAG: hypothetical protein M0004_10995 [Actinomycetota bacterium]|nr:hypothetical protein [Actinomycetota bacterium]